MYILAESIPMPATETISIITDIMISTAATSPMAMRVNMAMGEVNGTKDAAFIKALSTLPLLMENMTIKNATINSMVMGMTNVLISSTLVAREPTAPYKKA